MMITFRVLTRTKRGNGSLVVLEAFVDLQKLCWDVFCAHMKIWLHSIAYNWLAVQATQGPLLFTILLNDMEYPFEFLLNQATRTTQKNCTRLQCCLLSFFVVCRMPLLSAHLWSGCTTNFPSFIIRSRVPCVPR